MFIIPTWVISTLALILCIILLLSTIINKDRVALVLFLAFGYFTATYSVVDKFPPEETRFLVRLGFVVLFTSLIFIYGRLLVTKEFIVFIKTLSNKIKNRLKNLNWRK